MKTQFRKPLPIKPPKIETPKVIYNHQQMKRELEKEIKGEPLGLCESCSQKDSCQKTGRLVGHYMEFCNDYNERKEFNI